ncbi:MAG: phosphopentomutase [Bacilli bacterium]|nr:phosphopentomutase [Bacilli bacterium]
MKYKRIFIIVADSLGIGAAKDAAKYNDTGSNTLRHLSYSKIDFSIPTLEKLGIGLLTDVYNTKAVNHPLASYGKMQELSVGKDTLTGHWELMGLKVETPFPAFTDTGFPQELIRLLEEKTGYSIIGNISASGTEIIKDLGEEHIRTKSLIVYTSADSVLQIAAHEEVIPVPELYRVCEIARKITLDHPEWMVGRIIARPFIGSDKSNFTRTPNRHDYAVKPFGPTVLNYLKDADYDVIAIGKIRDIFEGEGITEFYKTKSNQDGMDRTIEMARKDFTGICFVNLVDFDALFGHRRDAIGYAKSVEEFDSDLARLLPHLNENDLLIICADHGNDPLHAGTDHTREDVPLLVYNKIRKGKNLNTRKTFADVGASIADNFNVKKPLIGKSFL